MIVKYRVLNAFFGGSASGAEKIIIIMNSYQKKVKEH